MNRLAAMEAFVRVVEVGSFSGAARQMHIGQPAISKAIAQLEDRLGVVLLLRSTHGLTPTEAGQKFYTHAKRAIEEADEADLAARGAGAGLSGQLRVSAAVTFARLHIVPRLPEFLAEHPGLSVDMVLDDRNVDLIENGIDVALRMGSQSDSSLTARKIGQGTRSVIATSAYLQRAGMPQTPEELTTHEAVIYDRRGGGAVWPFHKGEVEKVAVLNGRMRMSAAEGLRAAVLADFGLTVTSTWMFSPELETGVVQQVMTDWSLPPIDVWAVFPAGRQASAKARAFVQFVEKCLAEIAIH